MLSCYKYLWSQTAKILHSNKGGLSLGFGFSQNFQRKKIEMLQLKTKKNFKVQESSLISQNILIDALVPNFFIDELCLHKYPDKKSENKNSNYFLNSYSRITLPLETKPKLRFKLNKLFDNEVRIGRIFQLMDSIAGIVSYSHCYGGFIPGDIANEMICVTGSVQSLHLFAKIDIAKDLTIEGYLNHVGKTSMEIEINVLQEDQLKANSLFTMIARNADNPLKGFPVPALTFQGLSKEEEEKALWRKEYAKENVLRRREEINNSYDKKAPTPEEIQYIHSIFLRRKGGQSQELSSPISSTVISICEIMHTQRRNLHGKTFGGFLIKEMIDLGWVAGCKYAEQEVIIDDLTNIYFKRPVDIGCRLTLKATVTFVEDDRLMITIEAYTSKFTENKETLACYMHLVVRGQKQLKKVHPQSYEETLQYLSSRKAYTELFY